MKKTPPPVSPTNFRSLGLSEKLLTVLDGLGYKAPTPIQSLAIPPLLLGEDLIGQSSTGSGKTAAFAIPMLERLAPAEPTLQALILCPTRDLCTQVTGEIRKLGRYQANLQVRTITGGTSVLSQAQALERGIPIVVATPGRLLDHLRRDGLALGGLRTLVLDEADRMLDMGFRDDIEDILKQTPDSRQTALFSATFADNVLDISARYQRQPQRIEVRNAPAEIEQMRFEVGQEQRLPTLLAILRSRSFSSVLVFCNTRQSVDTLTRQLQQAEICADRLHGGLEQRERDLAMARFRNHSVRILVVTDVAARGLDIAGLDAVINFELPAQPEIYVHRIGRSGRAGAKGLALSLHSPEEAYRLLEIEAYSGVNIPLQQADSLGHAADTENTEQPIQNLQTLRISGGRKDKLRPGDILGALTGDAGLSADQVGRIEITDTVSFVALHAAVAGKAMARLRAGKIKGRRFRVELV